MHIGTLCTGSALDVPHDALPSEQLAKMKLLFPVLVLAYVIVLADATRLFETRRLHGSSLARQDGNNGIHLAVSPVCGPLSGNVSDVNAGIDLTRIKTIVAFGVRFFSLGIPSPKLACGEGKGVGSLVLPTEDAALSEH